MVIFHCLASSCSGHWIWYLDELSSRWLSKVSHAASYGPWLRDLSNIGYWVSGGSKEQLYIVMDVFGHAVLGFGGDPYLYCLGVQRVSTPRSWFLVCKESKCGYPAVNASYYDLSFHPVSSNNDCKLYKNSKAI
ncbi:hypothetical protein Ccrd_002510, partial [Cynara cardunculus var. scolymus]